MPRTDLLLLHASRAAVDPVSEYFLREAADLRPLSILDEGVMGLLREQSWPAAVDSLSGHIHRAIGAYGVRIALVTCSALGPEHMAALRARAGVAVIKIDEPMLTAAAQAQGVVGLLATFPSTVITSEAWLRFVRPGIEIRTVCDPAALDALLQGDRDTHDARLLAAARELASQGVNKVVCAQVSMARLAGEIARQTQLPVVESLSTSLEAIRMVL